MNKTALGLKRGRPCKYKWGGIGSTLYVPVKKNASETALRCKGAALRMSAMNAGLMVSVSRTAKAGYVAARVVGKK